MRAFLPIAFSVFAASSIMAQDDPAVRKNPIGRPMTPHQIEVEDLAKKAFGKAFQSVTQSGDTPEGDSIEVTCHVALEKASAAEIQKAIKNFTVAFHLAGFRSRSFAVAYETRVPDGLGNDKLTSLVKADLQQGLVPQVNWEAPDKIKFHVLFRSSVNVADFKAAWEKAGN